MTRWAELEATWRANRKRPDPLNIFQGVTGLQFLKVLAALHVATGDQRFDDASTAIRDHGILKTTRNGKSLIIKVKSHWKPIQVQARELLLCTAVDDVSLINGNIRRACAEVAAEYGVEAASFDAAVKRLKRLHTAWVARGERNNFANVPRPWVQTVLRDWNYAVIWNGAGYCSPRLFDGRRQ